MGSLYNNGFGGKLPFFHDWQRHSLRRRLLHGYRLLPLEECKSNLYLSRQPHQESGAITHFTMGFYFVAAQKNQQNSVYIQGILTFDASSPLSTGNAFADLLQGNIASYQPGPELHLLLRPLQELLNHTSRTTGASTRNSHSTLVCAGASSAATRKN